MQPATATIRQHCQQLFIANTLAALLYWKKEKQEKKFNDFKEKCYFLCQHNKQEKKKEQKQKQKQKHFISVKISKYRKKIIFMPQTIQDSKIKTKTKNDKRKMQ